METETNRPAGLEGQVNDEDLIDFDTDMADNVEQVSPPGQTNEQSLAAPTETDEELTEAIHLDVQHDDEIFVEDYADVGLEDHTEAADAEQVDQHSTSHQGEENDDAPSLGGKNQKQEEYVDISHDTEEAADEDGILSIHEIDYDLEGITGPSGQEHDTAEDQGTVDITAQDHGDQDTNTAVDAEYAEPDEITWEEEDGNVADDLSGNDAIASLHEAETTGETQEGSEPTEALEHQDVDEHPKDEELSQLAESRQGEDSSAGPEHHNEIEERADDQDEAELLRAESPTAESPRAESLHPSVAAEESMESSESEYPAITVCYKGDEFPLCSAGPDCFFTDTAILGESIDKLLHGLREELTQEIADEDELILQIDELGLEFAESTLNESVASITLSQILEVFDLLVKNQDPDSSRVLYTYLFTRPNSSKRFESLMESATAGKGLEEVIHIFAAPVPPGSGLLGSTTADGEIDDPLAEYDSPIDQAEEGTEGDQAAHPVNGEDQDIDNASSISHHDASEGENQHNVDNHADMHDGEDATDQDAAAASPVEIDVEANPFLNLDLDDAAEVDVDLGDDAAAEPLALLDDNVDDVEALVSIHSSATSTLHDDGDAGSTQINLKQAAAEQETTDVTRLDEIDPLAEIDWGEDVDAELAVPDTSSISGKRPREEDDQLAAEDEQDAKRICP